MIWTSSPCEGTGQANRHDQARPRRNGKRLRRRLGQQCSDFLYGHSTAGFGVANPLINRSKGFLVLLFIDGGGIVVEVDSIGLSR
jgi:hypothetical protein